MKPIFLTVYSKTLMSLSAVMSASTRRARGTLIFPLRKGKFFISSASTASSCSFILKYLVASSRALGCYLFSGCFRFNDNGFFRFFSGRLKDLQKLDHTVNDRFRAGRAS